ncbi:class IIb bacteriocin, lactobin A/cerein 7B family [Tenacibaculum sp. 190524A05c]|uniref:Natural product n=1 Tax=Tenacibaculum platacis TaxID=3137852 RepID=A0ABM9P553_9FLAO
MMKTIEDLKVFKTLNQKELKNINGGIDPTPVNGSGCTAHCARKGHWLIDQGWSGQDAHNWVKACIVSCNNG